MQEQGSLVRLAFMEGGNINFCHTQSIEFAKSTISSVKEGNYKVLSEEEFESLDKDFLHAYILKNEKFELDLEKAKEIKKNLLRIERFGILEKLDALFMRAVENGDEEEKKKIVERKNYYRNATSLVNMVGNIEDLRKLSVKDYSGMQVTVDDLRAAGFCAEGSKAWFKENGWDFKEFVKRGRLSDDGMNMEDERAKAVLSAAYKRINRV